MKKQIFIINGPAGAGKDTFVSMVRAIVPSLNHSSVELVKEAAVILGWDGTNKSDKDRKFLSDLKILTTSYSDVIGKWMIKIAKNFLEDEIHEFLFFHIREVDEIERFSKLLNAKTIVVVRDGVDPNQSNPADANVLNYDYDIIIRNDGSLGDLKTKAERFASIYSLDYGNSREEITDN